MKSTITPENYEPDVSILAKVESIHFRYTINFLQLSGNISNQFDIYNDRFSYTI
jgi:hypothetical protein